MIKLTKLDRSKVLVCLETVKYIEQIPDTIVRFTNGESLIVRESLTEIEEIVRSMRRSYLEADGSQNEKHRDTMNSSSVMIPDVVGSQADLSQ